LFGITTVTTLADSADFDELTLDPALYCADSGGFSSGSALFSNYTETGYWDGWAYSRKSQTDPIEKGLAGQYTAITGTAHSGTNYGIGYIGFYGNVPTITFGSSRVVDGIYVTNNNYAYYSMAEGDMFAKQFGVTRDAQGNIISDDDPDWFKLSITGKNADGQSTTINPIDFYLADFRGDAASDYIVDEWTYVDLTSLGFVKSLEFSLDSSDYSYGYMNTPGYFALDTVVPEPMTLVLLGLGGIMISRKRK
jgi:hypothetical protein